MTVIAGAISTDGRVFIGGDGVSVDNGDCIRRTVNPKVVEVGDFLIGSTGTLRVCQTIKSIFQPPKHKQDVDVEQYMIGEFVDGLRRLMQEAGGEYEDKSEGQRMMNGRCLVGYQGRLFEIDSGYGVLMPALPYHAIGCASQIALGAMYALRRSKPEAKVRAALEAAAEFDSNIRPPFTIKSIG